MVTQKFKMKFLNHTIISIKFQKKKKKKKKKKNNININYKKIFIK